MIFIYILCFVLPLAIWLPIGEAFCRLDASTTWITTYRARSTARS